MACMYAPCAMCSNFVKSTSIALNGTTNMIITIPATTYQNGDKLCLCLTQAIPAVTGNPVPVVLQFAGSTSTSYPLVNHCGNVVYSDQLRTRRIYNLSVASSNTSFMVHSRLCPTSATFGTVPATSTPEP